MSNFFSDLIPKQADENPPQSENAFSDLIPAAPADPASVPYYRDASGMIHMNIGGNPPPAAPPPPEPPQRSTGESMLRGLNIGTQGLVTGAIGSPIDLTTGIANAALWALNKTSGANEAGTPIGPIQNPVGGTKSIENALNTGRDLIGAAPVSPDNMSWGEKFAYRANQGAGAALGPSLALRTAALAQPGDALPKLGDSFLAPYKSGSYDPVAGDVAAGAGAGGAVEAGQSVIPDSWKGNWKGTLADTVLSLLGGSGGVTAGRMAMAPGSTMKSVINATTADPNVPTVNGKPFTPSMTERYARFKQDQADNPVRAAENVQQAAAEAQTAGLPAPTSGYASGDIGLAAGEKATRLSDSVPFQRQDQKVRTAVSDKLADTVPETGNPEAATGYVQRLTDTVKGLAQKAVDKVTGKATGVDIARQEAGGDLAGYGGQKNASDASSRIYNVFKETMEEQRAHKNNFYNDPAIGAETAPVDNLRKAAQAAKDAGSGLAGSDSVPSKLAEDILALPEGSQLSVAEIQKLRPRLKTEYAAARAAQDGAKIANLDKIRDAFADIMTQVSQRDTPGGKALRAAAENYADYAPKYATGAGAEVKSAIEQKTAVPSQEGYRFLDKEESAQQFAQILKDARNPQEGETAARKLLLNQASAAVDSSGKINAASIRRWRDDNNAVLAQFPDLKREADELVRAAVNGRDKANALAQDIRSAKANLNATEQELQRGSLSLLLGKSPEKAVQAVLNAPNPKMAMRDVVKQLGGRNSAALDGWKKAVAEYVDGVARGTNTQLTDSGDGAVQAAALKRFFDKHAATLAEVYTPEQMNAAQQVQKALGYYGAGARVAAAGSNTIENANLLESKVFKSLEVGWRILRGQLRGGGELKGIKNSYNLSMGGKRDWPQELELQFAFNPEVAHYILTRPVSEIGTPKWNAKLNMLLSLEAQPREDSK